MKLRTRRLPKVQAALTALALAAGSALASMAPASAALTVACSPVPGSPLAVGQQVSCTFNPPSGATFLSWTSSLFTPANSTQQTQTFTASTTGNGSITAGWTDQGGAGQSLTVTYPIGPSTMFAACKPGNGTAITVGQTVSCQFKNPNGTTFVGWGSNLFTPNSSSNPNQVFTAASSGSGSITALWNVSTGGQDQESFSYSIAPSQKIATCSPGSGRSVTVGQSVSCTFKAPTGTTFLNWTASLFDPSTSTSPSQVFKAITTGSGSISVAWNDATGTGQQETFSYSIAPSTAIASCNPASGSAVIVAQNVACTFKGQTGTTFAGWGASLFTPSSSTNPNQTFSAPTTGAGSITIFWKDSGGVQQQESFDYNVGPDTTIADCNPGDGSTIAVGSAVKCTFKFANGSSLVGWSASNFQPSTSVNPTQTFTASANGSGSVTVTWDDSGSVQHLESFSYTIAAHAWTLMSAPTPPGSKAGMQAIACASDSDCIAVGAQTSTSHQAFSERWDGTKWSLLTTPAPAGAVHSQIWDVACTGATNCTAVGDYGTASTNHLTLVEVFDGAAWTIVPSPDPAGASDSYLYGVACASAAKCVATGAAIIGGNAITVVESWDGASWTIIASPNQPTAVSSELFGVSCTGTTNCLAVGSYTKVSGGVTSYFPLSERWNGTAWSVLTVPAPAGATTSQLLRVSCASASSCVAGGYGGSATTPFGLAESWNGTKWSMVAAPRPAGASTTVFHGVACAAPSSCFVVGYYSVGTTPAITLTEAWNGTALSIVTSPYPAVSTQSVLRGVYCLRPTDCFATGSYATGSAPSLALAERYS